ncbi:MAG: transposase [Anaerolineaceae bacterium]|nr:transposase [Anaerolineaceae bacterium]
MYFLGIDWANDKHDLCLLDTEGRILTEMTIQQSLSGFQQLERLIMRYGVENVQLNIERSDGLLVDWIMAQGWALHVTPTVVVARRRPRRSKSDASDAYLLAYLLRLRDPDCRLLTRSSPIVLHLRELVRALDHALEELRRLANRLRYIVLQYFPNAVKLFTRIDHLIMLAFLEHYPTPEAARALTPTTLKAFLKAHHYYRYERIPKLLDILNLPTPVATVPDGYVAQVRVLVPIVRQFVRTIQQLEKEVIAVFQTHPEADWWKAFPGGRGPLTPARMLAWVGDDRNHFPTADTLQAIAGTAPITRRSGKSKTVEFRRACSHPLRKAADDFARQSCRYSSWAREYREAHLARGHSKARAYRSLANRWMKIVWTLWQRREWYCETLHIANRARRGQSEGTKLILRQAG